jgi:uncharacterized membrane protein
VAFAVWLAPAAPSAAPAASAARAQQSIDQAGAGFAAVRQIVDLRCVLCHNAQIQNKNIALHTPEHLRRHAQAVYQQAVVLRAMPLNNATQITDAERAQIKAWFESGAPME